MRVRGFFFVCMSVVAAMAVLAALAQVWSGLEDRSRLAHARAMADFQGTLLRLAERVSLERGSHTLALGASAPLSEEAAAKLAAERKATEAAFAAALAAAVDERGTAVEALRAKLVAAREPVLRAQAQPPGQRDAAVAKAWVAANFQVGDGVIATATGDLPALNTLAPAVADYVGLGHATANLRNQVGHRNTTLLVVIGNGAPMTTEQVERHNKLSGRIDQIWDEIKAELAMLDHGPAVSAAVSKVEKGLFGDAAAVIQSHEAASRAGAAYPLSAADFRSKTLPHFSAVGELRDAFVARGIEVCDAALAAATWRLTLASVWLVVLVVLIGGVTLLFNRRVVSTMIDTAAAISAMARDDLDVAVPGCARRDELGEIGRALETLRGNARAARDAAAERAAERAAREQARQRTDDQLRGLAERVETLLRAADHNVEVLKDSAVALAGQADGATQGSRHVARAADDAAANVQAVASATEQLLASVREIGHVVGTMADTARDAVAEAQHSRDSVNSLTEGAGRIGEIVALINTIAAQTNLLALNATIEAARAGEAGKGFAVVAGEVKALANQTAKATEQIQAQVAAIQGGTAATCSAISAIAATVGRMSELATSVASAVEQQNSATAEIARAIQQASDGVATVADNISGVQGAIDDTSRSAGAVGEVSSSLAAQTHTLRDEFGQVMELVRGTG